MSIIWELVKINILYSNPQLLASVKKKQGRRKDGSYSAYRSILIQQLFMTVTFGLLYSVFFLGADYSRSSGFFSLQLALFSLIATVYGFTGFFSVFYDSKDTKLYLSLPVTSQEVFIAKMISAQGMVLPFLMPCLSLLLITYWQIGGPSLALMALPAFFILWLAVNTVNLIVMHFVGQILTKNSQKTLISTILMTGSSLLAFGALMYLQSQQKVSLQSDGLVEFPALPFFVGFHYMVSDLLSIKGFVQFFLPLLGLIGLIGFAFKTVIPGYFGQMLAIETAANKRTKTKPAKLPQNLKQILIKHHLSTLKDSNLMVQTIIQPLIMGVALFPGFSQLAEDKAIIQSFGWDYFGIALLAGMILGNLFVGASTFIAVAMSLEKENYHFLRSLPINFKQFTIQKFWVVSAVQLVFPVLLYLVLAIGFFKLNLVLVLFLGIGLTISCLLTGQYYYWRDQRLLMLNWQNSNQLFGRGAGQWLIALSIIVTMLIGVFLMAISVIATASLGAVPVSAAITTLVLLVAAGLQVYFHKAYWSKL